MIVYVDGSCTGNGKAVNSGGFGVVVLDNNENLVYTYAKRSANTTNNREELKAILFALITYGRNKPTPIVYSDSAYCVNTFNDWMFRWASNNWIKSNGNSPENLDLIQAYYDFYNKGYRIDLRKIKGHVGHKYNELADKLATGKISEEEAIKIYG